MTREEAIYILKCLNPNGDMYSADSDDEIEEAYDMAIKALEQEPCTLDDVREDFVFDVYNILDFLPTNDEANRIIEVFDRVTSDIRQEPILDNIRAEIMKLKAFKIFMLDDEDEIYVERADVLSIIDKYNSRG